MKFWKEAHFPVNYQKCQACFLFLSLFLKHCTNVILFPLKSSWLSWRWNYNLLLFNSTVFCLQCVAEIQLDQLMCILMPRKNCWSHSMLDFVLVIQKIDFWVLGDGYPSMWILRCAPSLVSCKNSVTTCNVKCDVLPWSNDVMDGKINIKSSFVFTDYLL